MLSSERESDYKWPRWEMSLSLKWSTICNFNSFLWVPPFLLMTNYTTHGLCPAHSSQLLVSPALVCNVPPYLPVYVYRSCTPPQDALRGCFLSIFFQASPHLCFNYIQGRDMRWDPRSVADWVLTQTSCWTYWRRRQEPGFCFVRVGRFFSLLPLIIYNLSMALGMLLLLSVRIFAPGCLLFSLF